VCCQPSGQWTASTVQLMWLRFEILRSNLGGGSTTSGCNARLTGGQFRIRTRTSCTYTPVSASVLLPSAFLLGRRCRIGREVGRAQAWPCTA